MAAVQKTTYLIEKMDCPAEEQLVRMRLSEFQEIASLEFNLAGRKLDVYHHGDPGLIFKGIDSLDLGAKMLGTSTAQAGLPSQAQNTQRRLLLQVLFINLFFFLLESLTGILSNSMGLVADSLDMLADSLVYGLALFAIGSNLAMKKNVARTSGYLQLSLALFGLLEVARRFLGYEETPAFQTMILISTLALIGNATSLYLLQKSRDKEAHIQASVICTSNDVIANLGVILAGGLVYFTHSKIPDLLIGAIVFGIVLRGALRILRVSK